MAIYISKRSDDAGIEYIQAVDVFEGRSEEDPQTQHYYLFLSLVEKALNYYNDHSPTAFGNPELARYEGEVRGFLMAKRWEWSEETNNGICLISIRSHSGRLIMQIEKPSISKYEAKERKELSEALRSLGI